MEEQSGSNLQRLQELAKLIDNGEKVQETLETDGWKEIIGPLLDKMIIDVLGGKENGRWHNGSLGDKRIGEVRADRLLWYKRALTDFHEYIFSFIDSLSGYQEEYKEIVKEEENPEYRDLKTDYEEDAT